MKHAHVVVFLGVAPVAFRPWGVMQIRGVKVFGRNLS